MKTFTAALPHCLIAALLIAGCSRQASSPLTVVLATDPDSRRSTVRVEGLSTEELESLQAARLSDERWAALLRVTVANGPDGAPTVAGRFVTTSTAIEFTPRFPFDPGRKYNIAFDPSKLPTPRSGAVINETLAPPEAPPSDPTTITRMLPTAEELPENLLRFYIEFSAPMSSENGKDFIRLLDDAGKIVPDALLSIDVDFWSPDHRRYTFFFDPGRVKRGIQPNLELGRALRAGKTYTIEIDPRWRDAHGQPLATPFRHSFRAGPAEMKALRIEDWRVTPPNAGTRDPLTVTFPKPLDHGLMTRAVGVSRKGTTDALAGDAAIGRREVSWTFTPRIPWTAGAYDVVALGILEDPAGNRIGRPFDVDKFDTIDKSPAPERFTLPFVVK
jgi:hypothetical protein